MVSILVVFTLSFSGQYYVILSLFTGIILVTSSCFVYSGIVHLNAS